ncbi:hypothetical protein [Thalassobacillus pellis]|uniref:hypothetical protein n=1 Tax=Thalassobacillus pellis TaxID=748008 RepID=UPI0019600165|nr:hypothetical protein [Thalassobacillus pellis]MBM7551218.1 DUF1009 family protein [Thalassobacillus pellis]
MKSPKSFNMVLYPKKTIAINGAIYNIDITHEQFLEEFMEWVEVNGWSFLGVTEVTTEAKASDDLLTQFKAEQEDEENDRNN